jgi:hypothetical protein
MSLFFSNEQEMERQRRENTHDEEERLVIIGNGYSGDPYADDQRVWVRDIGGAGESGYNVPGIAYRVLAGGTGSLEIDKHVWIKWRKGPREWQIEMSDPDHMQQTGRSMHLENPSDPHNQFITTNRLMPLLSKPIGGGEVNVQGYAYLYDGVYRDYKGTSSVAGTHVDLIALKPVTASHIQYVVLAYNYAEFALGNNPIETFVSTSQTGDLDRTDIQECIAQIDLTVSRPIWAYRVDNAWTAADIVGHADDRDLRFWPDAPETIAGLSPLTTKGDLFTYSTVNDRLPVGANGTLLTPDSSTATGLKYETAANVVNPVLLAPGPMGSTTPNTGGFTTLSSVVNDAATNSATTVITLGHNTSGTPAAGYGTKLVFQGESSTTPDIDMAGIRSVWTTATHASRLSSLIFSTYAIGVETDVLTLSPSGVDSALNARFGPAGAALGDARLVVNGAAGLDAFLVRMTASTTTALKIQNSGTTVVAAFDISGHLAIGSNAQASLALNAVTTSEITTDIVNDRRGVSAGISFNGAGASARSYIGGAFSSASQSVNAQNLTSPTGGLQGGNFNVAHNGTGTLTSAYAGTMSITGKIITNATSLLIANSSITSGNTWGTYKGIEIWDPGGAGSLTNNYAIYINAIAKGGTLNYALYTNAGLVRLGDNTTIAGTLGVTGAITGSSTGALTVTDAATNTIVDALTLTHNSSGVAAGSNVFGSRVLYTGKSSTTANQNMASLDATWFVATDASRASQWDAAAYYTSTKQVGFSVRGDTGGVKTSVNGVTPVAPPTYGVPTGTPTRTTFDTATVTTAQLAERVYAMIIDLQAFGPIKA